MRDVIKDTFLESIHIKEELLHNNVSQLIEIAELVIEAIRKGGKLIVFGNGGSASDAQHIAAELVGRFKKERPGMPAIALTTNTSILTALANDYGYDIVFARQVEALGQKNDVVLGISTSGKAKNVAAGIKQAKKMGIKTVALSGGDGGDIAKLADVSLLVPSTSTPRIQEAHITIGHILCELIEQAVCQEEK